MLYISVRSFHSMRLNIKKWEFTGVIGINESRMLTVHGTSQLAKQPL